VRFCATHGIERATQLKRNPELFAAICRQLTQAVGFTLRKAAEILETSHTNGISLNTEIPQRYTRRCRLRTSLVCSFCDTYLAILNTTPAFMTPVTTLAGEMLW